MSTLTFKTNIHCSGCIAAVTPSLNNAVGASNWKVDTGNPDKILTVETEQASSDKIIHAVEKAGFNIQALD